jgi:hypothetical protein
MRLSKSLALLTMCSLKNPAGEVAGEHFRYLRQEEEAVVRPVRLAVVEAVQAYQRDRQALLRRL